MSPSPSLASLSVSSLSSKEQDETGEHASSVPSPKMLNRRSGSALSRTKGVRNLSSLGGACVESSTAKRQIPPYGTGPNEGWGHFVCPPSR
eukprot:CAMPEP_0172534292 /NCGR_PEP_ID=MMETSP1067-20121228/6713_1 /TAXON_ID=265564 ORGANISM="Thalassiosira punctigera, Strain Tpunct2005C2" /NCGR_SAMPLE_ID=MMETSP1067 /ASSEMBLY_ACC=CAM_ASM_000444 /LENGTH=90 /DNA_ID=CAMNT_0013319069 /DNA_START=226 /DNA_END=498 /DNA_ORIENTATION=+